MQMQKENLFIWLEFQYQTMDRHPGRKKKFQKELQNQARVQIKHFHV